MVEHARSVFARPVLGTIPARTLHQQGRKGVGLHTQAGSTADLTATQILHNAFSRHGKYARWMENPRWQAGPLPSSVVQSLRKCSGQMGGSSQSSCRTATLAPNCRHQKWCKSFVTIAAAAAPSSDECLDRSVSEMTFAITKHDEDCAVHLTAVTASSAVSDLFDVSHRTAPGHHSM